MLENIEALIKKIINVVAFLPFSQIIEMCKNFNTIFTTFQNICTLFSLKERLVYKRLFSKKQQKRILKLRIEQTKRYLQNR